MAHTAHCKNSRSVERPISVRIMRNMINVVSIPRKVVRLAAADAFVDERTATRVVLGIPTRPACRERVLEALAARGVDVATLPGAPELPSMTGPGVL